MVHFVSIEAAVPPEDSASPALYQSDPILATLCPETERESVCEQRLFLDLGAMFQDNHAAFFLPLTTITHDCSSLSFVQLSANSEKAKMRFLAS